MSNNSFNTLLDIYQTAKISETNRNTNLLFQAALQQNELILQLQRQIENAEANSNRIAAQQLEIQLRDEMARHEQKLLKTFIFNIEILLYDLAELTKLEEFIFLNKEFTPIFEYMPDVIERLDSIDDKRIASKLYKQLEERLKSSTSTEKEFKKSDFYKLERIEEKIQSFELGTGPIKGIVPEPKLIQYQSKYGISTVLLVLGTIFTSIMGLGLFYAVKASGLNKSSDTIIVFLYFLAQTILLPLYYVNKRKRNYKTMEDVIVENQKLNAENEELKRQKQEAFDLEMEAFLAKENELEQLKLQKSELENKIKSEHKKYRNFQQKVLKLFSPDKFQISR